MISIKEKKQKLRESFNKYNIAGYSEAPAGKGHIFHNMFYQNSDLVRGIKRQSSEKGLFKENFDLKFWWFSPTGEIIHENAVHLNNLGLISKRDSTVKNTNKGYYRIAVLGDEMTGATTSNVSWPDSLNEFLNENRPDQRYFEVLNFGHLDTGIHEWKKIWQERVRFFDIDLLIVNIADHTLRRVGEIFSDISHWDKLSGFRYVTYNLPSGLKAATWIYSPEGADELKHPSSYTSKLLTFWLPEELAKDKRQVALLRDLVIDDYVEGADFENCTDYLNPREVSHPKLPEYKTEEIFDWVSSHLNWFQKNVPNVMFLMNPWLPHFIDYNNFPNMDFLETLKPNVRVHDMRRSYKLWGVHDDISLLYSPHANEKWSDEGHRLYGEAVGLKVLEHLGFDLD